MPATGSTRILVLIKGLGRGGAEQLLVESAPLWDTRRFCYEVSYVLPWKDQLVEPLRRYGIPVHCIGSRRGMGLTAWRRLRRLIDQLDPHLIHAHLPSTGILARLVGGPPVVYTEHNLAGSYRPPTRLLNRLTFGRNAAVAAVTETVAESLAGFPGPAPVVIPNGVSVSVSPEEVERARAEAGIGNGGTLAVHVGNIRPLKGHETLIRATRLLAERRPDLRVVSIGGEKRPGDIERLRDRAAAEGVADRIRFLGRREDARAFIGAADVFVNPSDVEGLPLVVLEALALERPVVATAAGGVPSVVVDGQTGRLVPPGDPEALAAAVDALLDDPHRSEMAARGARLVESEYGASAMVRAYESLYRRVLDG